MAVAPEPTVQYALKKSLSQATGVTVSCQSERSQMFNRDTAMRQLIAKLLIIKQEENREKIEDIQGKYSQIAWGSQIRSYVFQPYTLVKDHRTGYETGNVESVMNGNIDEFINQYLCELIKKSRWFYEKRNSN